MKNVFLILTALFCVATSSYGYGLKTVITTEKNRTVRKHVLTCSSTSQTCKALCQNSNSCDLPVAEICTDCYKDSDLTLRSVFNEPQKRYFVDEFIYDTEATVRILKNEQLLIVGVRQNIFLDPTKPNDFAILQDKWNLMCPEPRDEEGQSYFLFKKDTAGYTPFALMCGEQINPLSYEISYGRGDVAEKAGEIQIRPENSVILKMSTELMEAK